MNRSIQSQDQFVVELVEYIKRHDRTGTTKISTYRSSNDARWMLEWAEPAGAVQIDIHAQVCEWQTNIHGVAMFITETAAALFKQKQARAKQAAVQEAQAKAALTFSAQVGVLL